MQMRKILSIFVIALCAAAAVAQKVPTPKDVLGFTPGDDRKLASWNQVLDYFQKLEDSSPRVKFDAIGKTTLDRPFVYATISSPENLRNLEKYKRINKQLADPRLIGRSDTRAKTLIKQGRSIVLITFGIHSTEVGSTLSSMLIAHRLASSNDPKIKKILDENIILLVPSLNPDGVDIVKSWYDKTLGTPFEGTTQPELYHHYIGHDNNRDWYIFSQIETKLTVDKLHNVWHPQIVHDVHQQGPNGARLFLPPYMDPVEPNVPKRIVEGYTELGNYIAEELRKDGFKGITTGTSYDAWTPARAYSHYHAGVRILTESASVRLATPTSVKFDDLEVEAGGADTKKESEKFGPVWPGGEWRLSDITRQMTEGAFKLLEHSADNREKWLTDFYQIGKDATRVRNRDEVAGYVIRGKELRDGNPTWDHYGRQMIIDILKRGGVEMRDISGRQSSGAVFPKGSVFIPMNQPYGAFAKTLLERQSYPNLLDEKGSPIRPYDVTAHTLPLLMGAEVEAVTERFLPRSVGSVAPPVVPNCPRTRDARPSALLYKSHVASMDEGWTRFIMNNAASYIGKCGPSFMNVTDSEIRSGEAFGGVKAVIFPDQTPNQIFRGHAKNTMPEEYTGGLGAEGVESLKRFVREGGTVVFFNRASRFAIREFGLPIRDVTEGLSNRDFYIPGSILRTKVDTLNPLAEGIPADSIAWFENSPVFDVAVGSNVKVVARYPENADEILLSGWALGAERLTGKAAMVEAPYGKGRLILFGFRPQYRAQSIATMPMIFNAIR
jgi:hypothetical protein